MADEYLDPAIMDFMIATNQYGVGPGYKSADYNDEQKKLNYIQDLFYTGDFDLNDLLGIGPAPDDPGQLAPYTGFQNDLRNVYAGNPALAQAFAEIDNGADPLATAAGVYKAAQEGKIDAGYLPSYTPSNQFGTSEPEISQQGIEELLTQYAANREREMSDQALYSRYADNWQTQADQYRMYNNPTSEYEMRGSPTVQQDIAGLKAQTDPRNYQGKVSGVRSQPTVQGGLGWQNVLSQIRGAAGQQQSVGLSPARMAAQVKNTVSQASQGNVTRDMSQGASNMIGQMARYRQGQQQRNVRPAGRELDNRRRQQAIYMLMNGELIG